MMVNPIPVIILMAIFLVPPLHTGIPNRLIVHFTTVIIESKVFDFKYKTNLNTEYSPMLKPVWHCTAERMQRGQ